MQEHANEISALGKQNPAVQRWADRTAELLVGYCADVHGTELKDCPFDEQVLFVASWQVWRATEGKPCWSKLDVRRLIDRITGGPDDNAPLRNSAVLTLVAFYCFLVKHGHLGREQASVVVEQLHPLWQESCAWMMDQLASSAEPQPHIAAEARLN